MLDHTLCRFRALAGSCATNRSRHLSVLATFVYLSTTAPPLLGAGVTIQPLEHTYGEETEFTITITGAKNGTTAKAVASDFQDTNTKAQDEVEVTSNRAELKIKFAPEKNKFDKIRIEAECDDGSSFEGSFVDFPQNGSGRPAFTYFPLNDAKCDGRIQFYAYGCKVENEEKGEDVFDYGYDTVIKFYRTPNSCCEEFQYIQLVERTGEGAHEERVDVEEGIDPAVNPFYGKQSAITKQGQVIGQEYSDSPGFTTNQTDLQATWNFKTYVVCKGDVKKVVARIDWTVTIKIDTEGEPSFTTEKAVIRCFNCMEDQHLSEVLESLEDKRGHVASLVERQGILEPEGMGCPISNFPDPAQSILPVPALSSIGRRLLILFLASMAVFMLRRFG